jgi:hypothetical protein
MVRIFINHDLVTTPEPVVTKGKIARGNAKVEAAKPEAFPVPSL